MTGIIYVIRVRKSTKKFVGATVLSLSRIWNAHKTWTNRGRRSPLHEAIRKLGPANFTLKEVDRVPVEQLRRKQKEWIQRLKSTVPKGYNPNSTSGHRAYLSLKDVNRIRELSKTVPQTSIAKKFKVSQATISKIITRKIYK